MDKNKPIYRGRFFNFDFLHGKSTHKYMGVKFNVLYTEELVWLNNLISQTKKKQGNDLCGWSPAFECYFFEEELFDHVKGYFNFHNKILREIDSTEFM